MFLIVRMLQIAWTCKLDACSALGHFQTEVQYACSTDFTMGCHDMLQPHKVRSADQDHCHVLDVEKLS
jgi:hypothetical protein